MQASQALLEIAWASIERTLFRLKHLPIFSSIFRTEKFWFFDDSDFLVVKNASTVKLIGAVRTNKYSEFCNEVSKLNARMEIPDKIELKWNDAPLNRKIIGNKKYEEYKIEFAHLVLRFFRGCFSVSQISKNDALCFLLKSAKIPKDCTFVLDEDLIEIDNKKRVIRKLSGFTWSSRSSKEEPGLRAADFFVGMMKMIIQQNSDISNHSIRINTPGYGRGITSAEFLLRMQTRWMLDGPVKEDIRGLPWRNCIKRSVFLSPKISPNVRAQFEYNFAKCYMGCTQ